LNINELMRRNMVKDIGRIQTMARGYMRQMVCPGRLPATPAPGRILLVCMLALIASACCREGIRTETQTLEREQWVGYMETVFDGVTLRLNNHTPIRNQYSTEQEDAFFKPDDSYLTIPLLEMDVGLDIPVHRQEPYSFYITDVNSTEFVPGHSRGMALVNIYFANQGRKLWGDCIDNIVCDLTPKPEIELNNMKLDIFLGLDARRGRLVISEIEAKVTADFSESGPCSDNFFAFLCDWLAPDRENDIKKAIESQIAGHFNSYSTIIEVLLNEYVKSQGVTGEIKSVTISNSGNMIMLVDYEDGNVSC